MPFGELADGHDRSLRELGGGKAARIVDKMPDNYVHLGLIATLFPDAAIIYCRRDFRDIAVSCWLTGFRSIRWTNAIEHIASRFAPARARDGPLAQRDARANPRGGLRRRSCPTSRRRARRLLAACGLEWDPACLDFHRTSRPVRTASFAQVRQPVYTSSIARWKNYQDELADLFAVLPQASGPNG